jgi:hypothetical protein
VISVGQPRTAPDPFSAATGVWPVEPDDLRELRSGWNFDCRPALVDVEVFKQVSP